MINITFVYPDFESIGIEYLMACCKKSGFEVSFVSYSGYDPYFYRKKINKKYDRIVKRISETNPHVVAFSCVTGNFPIQLKCAESVKRAMPRVITVFGGVHPTLVPERVIRHEAVDCVFIGEAEDVLPYFLSQCSQTDNALKLPNESIKGLVYKNNNNIIGAFESAENVIIDNLPFPYKEPLIKFFPYMRSNYKIITSRGCPFFCSYCFNSTLHLKRNNTLRKRPVCDVIEELKLAKSIYPLRYVHFLDDCFTESTRWLYEFSKKYREEIALPFWCLSHPNFINYEVVSLLKEAGCISMVIGIQSLSKRINKDILNRILDKKKIPKIIKNLKKRNIAVQVDHMLGIPEDSIKIEEKSILFYAKNKPDIISVFFLNYYPKTAIIDIAKEKGFLKNEDIEEIENAKSITNGELHSLYKETKENKKYYAIAFFLNILPLLPSFLIRLLVKTKLYRIFQIKNYLLSTVIPRLILCILNTNDINGRWHLNRFFNRHLIK